VIVEKPFTVNTEQADRLMATSNKVGKILTVFQSEQFLPINVTDYSAIADILLDRRYDSDFLTVQHLIQLKAFGTIHECSFHHDLGNPPWLKNMSDPTYQPGDGLTFGAGSHSIDQALELFGRPASVTGFLRNLRGVDSEVEDSFTIILQYMGELKNLFVEVKTNAVTKLSDQIKCVIRGYDGTFIKLGEDPQVEQAASGGKATDERFGLETRETYGTLTSKEKVHDDQVRVGDSWVGPFPTVRGCYMDYYRDVVRAVRGERELVIQPEQSRDGIRIIELARESAAKGCTLPFS